jgi:hypothetical protein
METVIEMYADVLGGRRKIRTAETSRTRATEGMWFDKGIN